MNKVSYFISRFILLLSRYLGLFLIILITLNIVASLILPILPKRTSDIARTIANDPKSISKELYKDKHEDYLIDVLSDLIEYMQIGVSYFPHTEYCETPFKSKTLNICTDPTGVTYRTGHKKCFVDIDSSTYRVYILGGSTSFGVFVADSETWPSRLSKLLMLKYPNRKIEVVNYAVTGYSITEEFLRLYDLVKLGHRPSMVIVLDGLNLGMESDQSRFTNSFFYTIKNIQTSYSFKETISRLLINMPISQLLLQMAPTKVLLYFFIKKASQEASNSPLEFYSDKSVVNFQSNRFNKGISDIQHLCNQFNIKLLYCLQPNAFYNYNIDSCSACTEIPNKTYKEDVGKIYSSILSNHPDVIDMTNLFSKFHNKAIVDDTHYSISFNAFIAEELMQNFKFDSLQKGIIDYNSATGAKFNLFVSPNKSAIK